MLNPVAANLLHHSNFFHSRTFADISIYPFAHIIHLQIVHFMPKSPSCDRGDPPATNRPPWLYASKETRTAATLPPTLSRSTRAACMVNPGPCPNHRRHLVARCARPLCSISSRTAAGIPYLARVFLGILPLSSPVRRCSDVFLSCKPSSDAHGFAAAVPHRSS